MKDVTDVRREATREVDTKNKSDGEVMIGRRDEEDEEERKTGNEGNEAYRKPERNNTKDSRARARASEPVRTSAARAITKIQIKVNAWHEKRRRRVLSVEC